RPGPPLPRPHAGAAARTGLTPNSLPACRTMASDGGPLMSDVAFERLTLWVARLVFGVLIVGCLGAGVWMGLMAVERRGAAQGTSGSPGTFTATHTKTEGRTNSEVCYGTLRLDGDGRQLRDIKATVAPWDCDSGREFHVRLAHGKAVTPGDTGWKYDAGMAGFLVVLGLVLVPFAIVSVRYRLKKVRAAEEAGQDAA
ncbi:hypothetical protein ACFQ07_12715, partial [Actinomadura adrarensis]